MFHGTTISLLVIATSFFSLTGCSKEKVSIPETGYYHSGIYFGTNFPANYQQGIADGCTTAKGEYRKSHTLFKNDQNYNDGWFLGRNRCKDQLVIEDEKERK